VVWTGLVSLRIGTSVRPVVNAIMNLKIIRQFLSDCKTGGHLSGAQLHKVSSLVNILKLGCLHTVACIRSGSGVSI
jgi:hypothetical protein